MPLEVKSIFEGIDHNAANWVKHYLTPGTDVSLEWNGIPDSVSGDTYKYSNQFDFNVNPKTLQYLYGYSGTLAFLNSTVYSSSGIVGSITYSLIDGLSNLDEISLWRLPLPDLPGVLLLHSTVGYTIGKQTFNTIGVPLFDPNWKPTMFGSWFDVTTGGDPLIHCNSAGVSAIKYPIGTYPEAYQVMSGYADNLTGYRLAGASVTVTNTSAPLYRNGTIVACNADTPLSRPYEIAMDDEIDKYPNINFGTNTVNVVDAPITYEAISSVKNYHKFDMKEGTYCVLHNLQGTFLSRNPEIDRIPGIWNASASNQVASLIMNTDNNTYVPLLFIISQNADVMQIPLVYTQADHAKYYENAGGKSRLWVPHPFIDPSSLSLWNSAFISFNMSDIGNTLNLSLKFNTYVECYVASHSSLKPNVSKSCRYHPSLIEYASEFYSYHDGIYVAADNDSGAVWEIFKKTAKEFADNVLKQTPYYPLAKAGFDLVKDLTGGGIKVTGETPQKHQAKQQKRAAQKEKKAAKKAAQVVVKQVVATAQGKVNKPKASKKKKQSKKQKRANAAARQELLAKAGLQRGKATSLAKAVARAIKVAKSTKVPSLEKLNRMSEKGHTILYDVIPVSRSKNAAKYLVDL